MLRNVVEWSDVDLGWLRTSWNQAPATTADALVAALLAKSGAGVRERVIGTRDVVNGVPAGGNWSSLDAIAELQFCTAGGVMVKVQLPAPAASIFLAGSTEVDALQIPAIITAALAVLVDDAGLPVVTYCGGDLRHRRRDVR